MEKKAGQGDSGGRKAEWGLYTAITEAQGSRNGNKGMDIFKKFLKFTCSFVIK